MQRGVKYKMYLYLDIVEKFACEMCGTCCRNDWMITVDEKSYRRNAEWFTMKGCSEEFHRSFMLLDKRGLGEYAYIAKQPGGACWFLDSANLCRLHREAGHDQLDAVCKTFPRYPMNTSRGVELTLSFSCPAVLQKMIRVEPLTIVRSEHSPWQETQREYAAEAFPVQQSRYHPLHYYFELESHFFDMIQCRAMAIDERLDFLAAIVNKVLEIPQDDFFGRSLRCMMEENYLLLDEKMGLQQIENCTPEILLEHFFANFIFKKPFYHYGLQKTIRLMLLMWQEIKEARRGAETFADDMEITKKTIMKMEYQYNHDRRHLLELFNNARRK